MFTSFHDSFWRELTLAATKLFLSLTRIDFAVLVSSRAVRISSRAVCVYLALSLRSVRPSYGAFYLMVFQGNCTRGRTGHMIRPYLLCMTLPSHYFLLFIPLLRYACFQPDKAGVFFEFFLEVFLHFHQAVSISCKHTVVHWLNNSKTFCSK